MTHARLTIEERLRRTHATLALLAELHRLAAADTDGLAPSASFSAANMASEAGRDVEHVLSALPAAALNVGAVDAERPRRRR